ncbi:MAG: pilus assembly protein TadG-related protein, partial [Candidatus Tectimicrobiota bacterium]
MFTGLQGDERGTVAPFVALLLVALMGFAAFAIDVGWIIVVRSELQNAADAGARAGVVDLVQDGEDAAYAMAGVYTTQPNHFLLTNPAPAADGVNVAVLGPETLRVQVRRTTGTTAGPVGTIFARVMGIETTEVRAVAVATVDRRIIGTGPGNLLPVAIKKEMVDADGDGFYDLRNIIDIFPHPWAVGDFGLLDLDGGSNSNDDIVRWIESGYDATFVIPQSAGDIYVEGSEHMNLEGKPGVVGESIGDAVYLRVGDRVLFPVFDEVSGHGANARFHIIDFVGAKIVEA